MTLPSPLPTPSSLRTPSPQSTPSPVAHTLDDYAALAAEAVPPDVRDFVAGGSGAELTVAANRRALDAVSVYPRVPGATGVDTTTTLLGGPSRLPVAVAPMAYQRLLHPDGEVATAVAAQRAGVPLVLSTLSSRTVEDVAATGAAWWLQLYWLRDRGLLEQLLDRAEAAGARALVLTLDVPVMGRRLRDVRNGFHLPADVVAANLLGDDTAGLARDDRAGRSAVAEHTAAAFAPRLAWSDLEWLRARTRLPIAVKGVLDPADADAAVAHGADAVVVSNHGGRQFDGAPASITALPAVLAEVAGAVPVLLDSGVRSGTDVLRALALGAAGVLLGRPVLWALAAGGADGVTDALTLLQDELTHAMTLAGCPDVPAAARLRTGTL